MQGPVLSYNPSPHDLRNSMDGAVFELIHRARNGDAAVLCASDLIELDGEDLRRAPVGYRKHKLARLVRTARPGIVVNEHYDGDGDIVFKYACKLGCEGRSKNRQPQNATLNRREFCPNAFCQIQKVSCGVFPSKTIPHGFDDSPQRFFIRDRIARFVLVPRHESLIPLACQCRRVLAVKVDALAALRLPNGFDALLDFSCPLGKLLFGFFIQRPTSRQTAEHGARYAVAVQAED
jgi:hypothetical protein